MTTITSPDAWNRDALVRWSGNFADAFVPG